VNVPGLFELGFTKLARRRTFLKVRMKNPPKIMHWTFPLPIKVIGAKNIYTLHDLVPLRLPYTTLDNKRDYVRLVKACIKYGDHICTVSETSKKDIINIFNVKEKDITNTFQAVTIPDKYRCKDEALVCEEVRGTFGVEYKEYFLFFGSIEPKKNLGRLIEAYLAAEVDTPLVIIGAQAWQSEQELRLLNDDRVTYYQQVGDRWIKKKKIMLLPYAPFPLLVSMIRGAKAVLFPSLYEGFGLPILEAMLLGTPVLTSLEGSTPEVAGDAAAMVDPYNVRDIVAGIKALDSNAELRAELSVRGRIQAEKYNAKNYINLLNTMYNKII
jgi:glycosyltransferase involved in cell wall biosynthesis